MDDPSAAVLAANLSFYTALSLADYNLMERVWLAAPEAVCIHPGWPALHGWEPIRQSWREIFRSQGPLRIWPTELQLRLYGQTAEVNCLENIDMNQVRGAGILQTRATNVFRLVGGAWKMLEHHATSVPGGDTQPLKPFSTN
jgi:ketosteroid isomerase-like protein